MFLMIDVPLYLEIAFSVERTRVRQPQSSRVYTLISHAQTPHPKHGLEGQILAWAWTIFRAKVLKTFQVVPSSLGGGMVSMNEWSAVGVSDFPGIPVTFQ